MNNFILALLQHEEDQGLFIFLKDAENKVTALFSSLFLDPAATEEPTLEHVAEHIIDTFMTMRN